MPQIKRDQKIVYTSSYTLENNRFNNKNSFTIWGMDTIQYLCVGNKYGLLVPHIIHDEEIQLFQSKLPEDVKVHVAPENCFTSLGNIIACNDSVALVHPELSHEVIDLLETALKVKVHPITIGDCLLVDTVCQLTNEKGKVDSDIDVYVIHKLSQITGVEVE